ncbi:unnamed protein product [Sphenostylis stenocarpa]|uniref:Uncharacterized protein n=1 Tax=Sphenostylis stenocarpa TaxID=92480 RepID=A0AA86W4Y3_9FABA|nr:unnamed protein product [Sphenostylis stenocarpa]
MKYDNCISISQNIKFPALAATLLKTSINVYIVCRDLNLRHTTKMEGKKEVKEKKIEVEVIPLSSGSSTV